MATKKKNATKTTDANDTTAPTKATTKNASESHDHVRDGAVFRVAVDDKPAATKKNARASNRHVSRSTADANGIKGGEVTETGVAIHVDDQAKANAPAAKKSKRASKPVVELTLATLSEGYLHALEDTGAGTGTLASYGMELKLATRELGSETPVALLTDDRVREYFNSDAVMKTRTGKPKAPPTYLKTQRVLRQALVWAATEKLIEKAPVPEMSAAK